MAEFQDVWTQTDASYDLDTERLVRLWLLDAAIHQYSFDIPSERSEQAWLPDSVFQYPGMSEEEMVEFMKSRGATEGCIEYALCRFEEANSEEANGDVGHKEGPKNLASSTEVGKMKDEEVCSKKTTGYRAIDFILNPVRAIRRFSKRLKTKKREECRFLVSNDALCAFPISLAENEDPKDTGSV